MHVVFLGTPTFACTVLDALHEAEDVDIALVVSQPDRPRSRGRVTPTPVKERAQALGYSVITPPSVNAPDVVAQIEACAPDFLIVVAFGQLIGRHLLEAFPGRILNVHASLLPAYRGAAPIERALMSGADETGVSIMRIVRALDAGDVLAADAVPMDDNTTFDALQESMAKCGATLLLDTLRHFPARDAARVAQDDAKATYAEKLTSADSPLDWTRPARLLVRQVHALADGPGAKTRRGEDVLRIHEAHAEADGENARPGTVVRADKNGIAVATGDGLLVIDRLQAPNRKALAARDFLNGDPIRVGECLSVEGRP